MTETEWLDSTDPMSMGYRLGDRFSDRKARLYVCAWARKLWDRLPDERSRNAVLAAERFADYRVTEGELLAAFRRANDACDAIPEDGGSRRARRKAMRFRLEGKDAALVARNAADPNLTRRSLECVCLQTKMMFFLADVMRDLFGPLPFRSCAIEPHWLSWNGGAVVAVARDIHDNSQGGHHPILADALEDAGCENADILRHLRGGGVHVCGCWVIDQILGKS